MNERRGDERAVLEGWQAFGREYAPEELSTEERAQFDRARLADEQTKNTNYVVGGRIFHSL
jgi:hypothetical protein